MPIRLRPADASRLGIVIPPAPGSHAAVVARYSDELLEAVIADLGARNLRDQRDHDTRWAAQRCAAARAERRARKEARR